MQKRWYIAIIVLILTVFGVVTQNNIEKPNQEIVLHLNNDLSEDQIATTIASLKSDLNNFGASVIKVTINKAKSLTISYYSTAKIAEVKTVLENNTSLLITNSESFPLSSSGQQQSTLDFDIYEITSANIDADFDGNLAIEVIQDNDRFSNLKILTSSSINDVKKYDIIATNRLKDYKKALNISGKNHHAIPEVRAGPIAIRTI